MDLYSADLLSLDAKITLNTSEYDRKISEAIQKAEKLSDTLNGMDGQKVGDLITDTVSRNIAQSATTTTHYVVL